MPELADLVAAAERSQLFTGPSLEADTARFLADHGAAIRAMGRRDRSVGRQRIFFVGAGGSWASMYSGAYLLRRYSRMPTDVMLPYQLIWEAPVSLDRDATAFFASYSGETEDTLAGLRFAKSRGAHTIAIVKDERSTIGREADEVIAYHGRDLYGLPLCAAYLYAGELAGSDGGLDIEELAGALDRLPPILGKAFADDRARGQELAQDLLPEQVLYCLGSGPLYGLAYKFALTVFMENIRVHGSVIETSEFRHGPAEMLERQRATIFNLVGSDGSRPMSERAGAIATAHGARVETFDIRAYGDVHPLLAPLVLLVPLQWFVVYSALLRGILDLDERVLMGRGVLATGGASWP